MRGEMDYYMFILCNIDGIGFKTVCLLLDTFKDAKNALSQDMDSYREILPESKAKLLMTGLHKTVLNERLKVMSRENIEFIPFFSPKYPIKLKNIPDPPLALYVKGELPSGDEPAVAVVGARECSEYGKICAEAIGRDLGRNKINVISGLARGIDSIAQQSAICSGGKTYGVLGGGVDVVYPTQNAGLYKDVISHGGLISEYPVGTMPKRDLFPARNRIISGLADVVVVVEARVRSGTYITVSQALEQDREVMVVPGRITDGLSVGCNNLIRQGAAIITSPSDVIDMLSSMGKIDFRTQSNKESAEEDFGDASCLLKNLEITPTDIGVLLNKVVKYGYTYEKMCAELAILEIEGRVKKVGNSFIRTDAKSHI